MSKEQTPIEEFYYKWQTQDFEHKRIEMPNFTEEELLNFGEQYAQYREKKAVLEALERFVDWCDEDEGHFKSKEELIKAFMKQK
jgi:hypothetical protein